MLLLHRIETLLLSLNPPCLDHRFQEPCTNLQNAIALRVVIIVELLHHPLEIHRILRSHARLTPTTSSPSRL